MADLGKCTITELSGKIRAGETTSLALTEHYLARIQAHNEKLNAFLKVFEQSAREEAKRADEAIAAGNSLGPLHGVPLGIKDIIDIKGEVTSAGGKLLPNEPATEDAPVIARLRAAGAVILGKLNLHEYAWGGTTNNPHFGKCYNPWGEGLTPGGSSGGSGAAVAAGLCAAALGTDTLGSVRIPASYCGCVGLKTSYGLVSNRRVFPLSWTLDTVGPLTRSAQDAALMVAAMACPDAAEPTSAMRELGPIDIEDKPNVEGMRIGIINGYSLGHDGSDAKREVSEAVEAAVGVLTSLGCTRVDLDLPEIIQAGLAAINIALVEAAAIHAQHMANNPGDIGEDVRLRLQLGASLTGIQLAEAFRLQAVSSNKIAAVMRDVDCLIYPATETPAHAFDENLSQSTARFTSPANGTGGPAVSMRCGFSTDGLPIGMQIVGAPFEEAKILRIAAAYEAATDWTSRTPPGLGLD